MQVKKQNLKLGQPVLKWTAGAVMAALMGAGIVNCGGGGGGGTSGSGSALPPGQNLQESASQINPANCANVADESAANAACNNFRLTSAEVQTILAQGADAARQLGVNGVIAVVDRVGNVLGVYSTVTQANIPAGNILITSNRGITNSGLDNVTQPNTAAPLFAIAKAITGAYLSSSGNAFSTRTASLIVQENFYPGEIGQPAGPLFGVQFSQLPCGDLVRDVNQDGLAGPKRSPLGLAADPGGFPLYKNGVVVGGIGFISYGGQYTLDSEPRNTDNDPEEVIAWTATKGYEAPESIRGNRISGGGVFLLFSDTNGISTSATSLTSPGLNGELQAVGGYKATAAITPGIPYGAPGSGYRASTANDALGGNLTARNAFLLTNPAGDTNRYPPTAGTSPAGNSLSVDDVRNLLDKAYEIASRGRAQIRFPTGSAIQVTISVVDTAGTPLGIVRTPDAPVFGTDVSLQKARTAMFMSSQLSTAQKTLINATTGTNRYINVTGFETVTQFDGSVAFSDRGFGNYDRPFYPDGDNSKANGPFSLPFSRWSPFSTGLQLDLVAGKVLANLAATSTDTIARSRTCSPESGGVSLPIANGLQIFPGGFPIYRNGVLIGGIGISGDGIDQDDMISFLGIENARLAGASVAHAPKAIRIDNFVVGGARARYVNCPFKPFNDSDQTNPCEGI